MSEIEHIVGPTRRLETLLKSQYHAQGRNLDELISSCEERLPHDMIAKLRYVAGVVRKVVNGESVQAEDQKALLSIVRECEKALTPRSGRFIWRIALMLMLLMTLAAMGVYYVHWEELSQHLQ